MTIDAPGVETAVEKILTEAPIKEKPLEEAPVVETPKKEVETSTEAKPEVKVEAEGERDADGLTAFEKELVALLPEDQQQKFSRMSAEGKTDHLQGLKVVYRAQARDGTELGNLRKAVKTLNDAGVTNDDLVKLVASKRGTTVTPMAVKEEAKKERGYKRFLSEAKDANERESLLDAESAIKELIEDEVNRRLDKEVKPLRERQDKLDNQTLSRRSQDLGAEIDKLEDELGWPGSVVESYRSRLEQAGRTRTDMDAEELFYRIASKKDIRTVLAATKPEALEPAKRGTKPASPVITKPTQTDDIPRKARGVGSITKTLDMILHPQRK